MLLTSLNEVELKDALQFLTKCLYTYYKKQVIVLIDEYDRPIDSAYLVNREVKNVFKYSIAFHKKTCVVAMESE